MAVGLAAFVFNEFFMPKGRLFIGLNSCLASNLLHMLRACLLPESLRSHAVHRIAHPTDLTEASANALEWAAHLAQDNDADLLFLHVVPPPTPIFEAESPTKGRAELEISLLLAQAKLNGLRARGFVLCGTGSIDRQILEAVRLEDIDMIVMGTSGRTGFSRLLAGSVASRVISRARCPVLVIPSRLTEQRHRFSLRLDLGTAHG